MINLRLILWVAGGLLALCPASIWADEASVDGLVAKGLGLERQLDPRAALEVFRAAAKGRPDDAFIQQKIAQQLSDAAFLEPDPRVRDRLTHEALQHAQQAVALDPNSAVARLSLSVLYGKLSVESDVRTKIKYARLIREHAEAALELKPDYAWAWHVLGRWHVELSQLGLARRAIVNLIFGGLPAASLEEGIRMLEQAVRLENGAVGHRVELGFAYHLAERPDRARLCWEEALALPSARIYDPVAKARAAAALAEFHGDDAAFAHPQG